MRWIKLLQRYSLVRKPTLRVVNPRVGTSIIPLDGDDDQIFFQYLSNKVHSLHFEGTEVQLTKIINKMTAKRGCTIHKMKTTMSRDSERIVILHLKLPGDVEIRRMIKIT